MYLQSENPFYCSCRRSSGDVRIAGLCPSPSHEPFVIFSFSWCPPPRVDRALYLKPTTLPHSIFVMADSQKNSLRCVCAMASRCSLAHQACFQAGRLVRQLDPSICTKLHKMQNCVTTLVMLHAI